MNQEWGCNNFVVLIYGEKKWGAFIYDGFDNDLCSMRVFNNIDRVNG